MQRNLLLTACSLLLFLGIESCAQQAKEKKMIYLSENYVKFPYSIYEPDVSCKLTDELREISGLAYYGDHELLCVNDEKGIVYKYNIKEKKIQEKYKFERPGDYEGIEMIGSDVYALRSDGTLFKISNLTEKTISSEKHSTFLNALNNTEGLAYHEQTNSLLIACKGNPGRKMENLGKRAIYKYSVKDNKLSETPAFLIDQEQIRKILKFNSYARFSVKLLESVNPSEGDITFQPSAIAVHPLTKNIYVLGSVGKLLLVLGPQGDILAIVKLKRKLFRQPEGICFSPEGTLFISNEGKGKKATIFQFNLKK